MSAPGPSSAAAATATFTCGRCRQPLTIRATPNTVASLAAQYGSQQGIGDSQYDLLASHASLQAVRSHSDGTLDKGVEALLYNDANLNPLIPRKIVLGPPGSRQQQSDLQKHFDALSSQSEADHPLCAECCKAWFAQMSEVVEEQKKTRELLIEYEKDIKARKQELEAHNEWLVKDTIRLEKEEKDLIEQLLQTEKQKDELDEEMRQLDREEEALQAEEKE